MIYHFPNFVCWEDIQQDYRPERDLVFLDSISCYLIGLILGKKGHYLPGSQMAHKLYENHRSDCFFLLSQEIESINHEKRLILPFKDSFEDDIALKKFVLSLPSNVKLIIGISSPKQNYLAHHLYTLRPDIELYCLGAAVELTWDTSYGNTQLRGTGLQWIEFFIFQPRRTLKKMIETLVAIISLIFSRRRITLYKIFVDNTRLSRNIFFTDDGQ